MLPGSAAEAGDELNPPECLGLYTRPADANKPRRGPSAHFVLSLVEVDEVEDGRAAT